MKKWVGGVLVLSFFMGLSGIAFAQEAKAKPVVKAAAKEIAVETKAVTPEPAGLSVKDIITNQALEKAKETLISQEWLVYVMPAAGKRSRGMEEDTMIFKDGKISSKNLLAKGYPESNFTLKMQDEYTAVFETMQVNEKEGIAFIRGELNGSVLKGVISMQPKKGEKEAMNFSSEKPEAQAQPALQEPAKKKGKK